ncbi:MAG: bifunctional hydroxymethylpyrimidine kinase/phosphomethylpyrimidine kinase [Rickettsiales bacterium]|nr:bifunctional hydroxymethylpyrimidine kinase/phosphomethylpyrimidine kinase [Rickettsiales bacterium]
MAKPLGRVLVIAGSDSGGGAGVQGDIKTITCLSGYAATAITSITAQNTQGVYGIHDIPTEMIRRQIELVIEDIGVDAIKTGMLHTTDIIQTVADTLWPYISAIPLVIDPVMFAKGGSALLQPEALSTLKKRLIPMATVITPNIPEAEYLSGRDIRSLADMKLAAKMMLSMGCRAVLLKGGHADGDEVTDILMSAEGCEVYRHKRIHSLHTHGTGCSMASAIATGLSQGLDLPQAVDRARKYVLKAIALAPQIGKGHGPLGHGHTVKRFPS